MSRARKLSLALASLAASAGAIALGLRYVPSIEPAPVPGIDALRPGAANPPRARRVVVVVIDGARRDRMEEAMSARPSGRALLARAARFAGRSGHPTLSRPMYATLGSGASPELHGVASNSHRGAIRVDSVLAAARRLSVPVLLRDDEATGWWDLYGSPPEERARTIEQTLARVRGAGRLLAYVHLLEPDERAHAEGARSDAYAKALRRAASRVEELAAALDLDRDVLIVTADHGHRDRGGHGGQEPEVVAVPLWLVGKGIRPGHHGVATLEDVAPTVAVQAGLPFPAHARGRPLLEAIELRDGEQHGVLARWIWQRWRLSNALRTGLGAPAMLPPTVPEGAHAAATARLMATGFGEGERAALDARDRRETWIRAAAVTPLFLFALYTFARRRPRASALLCALAAAALFYGACALFFPFSISAVRERSELYAWVGVIAIVTQNAIATGSLLRARRSRDRKWVADVGVFTVLVAALEVAAMFVWTGLGAASGLPGPAAYLVPALALTRFAVAVPTWGLTVALLAPR